MICINSKIHENNRKVSNITFVDHEMTLVEQDAIPCRITDNICIHLRLLSNQWYKTFQRSITLYPRMRWTQFQIIRDLLLTPLTPYWEEQRRNDVWSWARQVNPVAFIKTIDHNLRSFGNWPCELSKAIIA